MHTLAIIGVPSSAGARRIGQEKAPQALRQAGLVAQMQSAGLAALQIFARGRQFAGMVVTEFNGDRDVDGTSAERLAQGITGALWGPIHDAGNTCP